MTAEPRLVQVAAGVHAWIGAGGDSNAGIVETPHGLVAIDAQQTITLGTLFRRSAEASLGRPVCRLINTHFHLDHIAGNPAFADVPIIAHQRTLALLHGMLGEGTGWSVADAATKLKLFFGGNFSELVAPDDPGATWFEARVSGPGYEVMQLLAPSETFADMLALQTGRDMLVARYLGPAHCDGDLVLHVPRAGVVFLGDLLFVGRFPWFGDCDLAGWIARLDSVLAMDVGVVIPGHGPPAGLREVAAFRGLLSDVLEAVAAAVRQGWSEEAVVAGVRLPHHAGLPRYEAWLPANLRATYRALRR